MKRQRKNGWSAVDRQYLIDNWDAYTNEQLAKYLNRSIGSIQTIASKELGLKRSSKALSQRVSDAWSNREGTWSAGEKQFLIDNWQTKTRAELAKALGRTPLAVRSMGEKELGLRKTADAKKAIYKRSTSRSQFKKGNLPHNTIYGKELTIRVRKNKNGPAYKWIRIGFRQWKQFHLYLWEQEHGIVPDGFCVTFRNGDQMDVRLENLELISVQDNAIRNSASINLTDNWVANTISRDKELKRELLKHPDLIDLKRTQIQLQRLLKSS